MKLAIHLLFIFILPSISFAGIPNLTDIVALNSVINKGSVGEIILFLPPSSDEFKRWSLYIDNYEGKYPSGMLSNLPIIDRHNIRITERGKHTVILVLFNESQQPILFRTCSIEVVPKNVEKILENSSGAIIGGLLGALMAILVFILQAEIKNYYERKTSFIAMKSAMKLFIEEAKIKFSNNQSISIPSWIENPFESEWRIYFINSPYLTLIPELRKIVKNANHNYISGVDANQLILNIERNLIS